MDVCAIFRCTNNSRDKGIYFHRYPKDPKVSKVCINVSKRSGNANARDARICSVYFRTEDYERNLQHELIPQLYHRLKKTIVPSVNLLLSDVIQIWVPAHNGSFLPHLDSRLCVFV